ncbi:19935_t:CDS:2 [Dentiscutata erythropus]|uniref:19935_t:CDS:1 n=1 Tax=Dentiscutata erythropus TaxID=1348616 RepID=A0A9N9DCK6_9GLOM|nr:19935_t:CDS:2 [Dentiscutata erythropus]
MSNLNLQTIPTESLNLALILHSKIELKTWTGDVKAEIKSFYGAIEHALQKLEHLKETPEDVKAAVLAISSLHKNNKLAISSPSYKKEDNQNDICMHISNLKSILENIEDFEAKELILYYRRELQFELEQCSRNIIRFIGIFIKIIFIST